MTKYCSARTFICAFYTFLAPLFVFANEKFTDEEWSRLEAGEFIVSETRLDESGGSVRIRILVQAPSIRIWNVISRCPYAYRYLAGLEECEVMVDEPDRALTRHVIDAGIFAPTLDYTFETRRNPYSRMDLGLVEGNLKQMDGYWKFNAGESGVVLEHEVHLQPLVPAPRWLVRRKLRKDLPAMMLCIRGMSGGSPDPETESRDLAACQQEDALGNQ